MTEQKDQQKIQIAECEIPNEEYETQFFGFAPTDVYEGIKGLITDRFEYTIDKLGKQMQKIPQDILSGKELSEGIGRLRLITSENMNTTLNKVKKHLLQNIFKIPPHLLLPEDVDQTVPISTEEKKALADEIEELKWQLKAGKYMEASLAEELKDQEMVIQSQKWLLENKFSPSFQNALEEKGESIIFLASNANPLLSNFHSLQRMVDASVIEECFQDNFESGTLC